MIAIEIRNIIFPPEIKWLQPNFYSRTEIKWLQPKFYSPNLNQLMIATEILISHPNSIFLIATEILFHNRNQMIANEILFPQPKSITDCSRNCMLPPEIKLLQNFIFPTSQLNFSGLDRIQSFS